MRVVIAEDAAVLRELLAQMLTERGHEVPAAVADAVALCAAVAEHHPDVAVVDIRYIRCPRGDCHKQPCLYQWRYRNQQSHGRFAKPCVAAQPEHHL